MAEPKPAESNETPSLVAVSPEKSEAKPAEAPKAAPAKPQAAPSPAAAAPEKQQGTRWGLWLLVVLVAGAAAAAWVQTQRLTQAEGRVTALSERVVALEAQVAAANLQIQSYETQRTQVRRAVSDISQQILLLTELIGGPLESTPPPAEPVSD